MMFTELLSASVMMTLVGTASWLLMRSFPIQSWRLRSLLATLVLLQGLMFIRVPLHLGWIESPLPSVNQLESKYSDTIPAPVLGSAYDHQAELKTSLQPSEVQQTWLESIRNAVDRVHWLALLAVLWGSVVSFTLLRMVWQYLRLLSLVGKLKQAPESWQQPWRRLLKRSGHRSKPSHCAMCVSDTVGPMLIRRWSGYTLIVPARYWEELNEIQRHGVLLHELAHLERRDVWRQLVLRLVATAHWFNPAAWWAMGQYEMASELACDRRVAQDGKRTAAGFASALLQFVQWHEESSVPTPIRRGMGFQMMAAPPLTSRVSQLLQPDSRGDSKMKRLATILLALPLVAVSFVQFRLTAEAVEPAEPRELEVMDESVESRVRDIVAQLDPSDSVTGRFAELFDTPSGKIAIAGMLNSLRGQAREEAGANAIPRFMSHHFQLADDKWQPREGTQSVMDRWVKQAERLSNDSDKMGAAMKDIAGKLDTSNEAGALFQRLLQDPQAPVAVMINEMNGGDVVSRFISDALGKIMVDQGDGTFTIVQSRRAEAEKLIEQFELAGKIAKRLEKELPVLASEYSAGDEQHKQFVRYLNNPTAAMVAAFQMAEKNLTVGAAVSNLHEHFENVSKDTSKGLVIVNPEAWQHLDDLFAVVDRVDSVFVQVQERLAEVADTLSTSDDLSSRMATQMRSKPAAMRIAAELPYANADAGAEIRALVSEVFEESNGKLTVNDDQAEALEKKAGELLKVCRKIRRYNMEIQEQLDLVTNQSFVSKLGPNGGYVILSEVKRFAERHQPDPVALMKDQLLAQADNGKLRVRNDRHEVVRKLVEQSEKVRAEAAKDDF